MKHLISMMKIQIHVIYTIVHFIKNKLLRYMYCPLHFHASNEHEVKHDYICKSLSTVASTIFISNWVFLSIFCWTTCHITHLSSYIFIFKTNCTLNPLVMLFKFSYTYVHLCETLIKCESMLQCIWGYLHIFFMGDCTLRVCQKIFKRICLYISVFMKIWKLYCRAVLALGKV